MDRRTFLGVLGGTALSAVSCQPSAVSHVSGQIVGQSVRVGHRLREGKLPPPASTRKTRTVIVGGGVAGLSAAWALDRARWDDFLVLELEAEAGGTSLWHDYPESSCPWGAHYLPLTTSDSRAVRALLQELGVIVGWEADGTPRYEETYLCQAPQERLYVDGLWQDGIYPHSGASHTDLAELAAFQSDMEQWRHRRGRDGKPGFTIPMEYGSRDPVFTDLDRISMARYLDSKGFRSTRLRWFVEYACRDDYGCTLDNTSAWAGIHYYTSRPQKKKDSDQLLTWPEGNGWLARRLRARAGQRVVPNALTFSVTADSGEAVVDFYDTRNHQSIRVRADSAIVAVPRFVAARIVPGYTAQGFSYAPWIVSNVVLERAPPDSPGQPLSWDNVMHQSRSLGYVVATHQSLRTVDGPTVLTHYQPLVGADAVASRNWALRRPWEDWRDLVLQDLAVPHPGIERTVRRLDVMVWGHAMVRPTVGFIWGGERERAARSLSRIRFAHCDLSGLPIFEEAQYHGVLAAEASMRDASHPFETLL